MNTGRSDCAAAVAAMAGAQAVKVARSLSPAVDGDRRISFTFIDRQERNVAVFLNSEGVAPQSPGSLREQRTLGHSAETVGNSEGVAQTCVFLCNSFRVESK